MTTLQRPSVTAESASFTYYDLESLSNAFTMSAYTPRPDGELDTLEMFFLADDTEIERAVDPQRLYEAVIATNPGLPQVRVSLWNLATKNANYRFATLMGLSNADQICNRNDTGQYPAQFRLVCDTDPEYDPYQHPFLVGYNSLNYDTTMTALYLNETFPNPGRGEIFQPTTAQTMRDHNNSLFNQHIEYMPGYLGWDGPTAKIRRAMINSGRHLDASRLNELQSKVSLKRLLGMLGRQIKESDKLSGETTIATVDELYELLAYNVSDCLGLQQLFRHPVYSNNFTLKAGLLAQYSETVFDKHGNVRRDRLTIDSSSAKFVGRILAPDEPLKDIEAVSFLYPDPEVAKEQGVTPVNVLTECVDFFKKNVVPGLFEEDHVTLPIDEANGRQAKTVANPDPVQLAAWRAFEPIVKYYRSIEGENFNDSEEYQDKFSLPPQHLGNIAKVPNNVPYFHADATPSSCFVTFTTGGIHSAEADLTAYEQARDAHTNLMTMYQLARQIYPDATDFVEEAKRQHNTLPLPDGTYVDKRLVLLGSDPEKVKYRRPKPKPATPEEVAQNQQIAAAMAHYPTAADLLARQRPTAEELFVYLSDGSVLEGKAVLANASVSRASYRDPDKIAKDEPKLFVQKKTDDSTSLNPSFVRSSVGLVIHEDFTSYYPNLLRNMRAFYNPELGEDRYTKIFFDKERYGKEMKRPGITDEERNRLDILRNGTKLILNSASGAGDASHRTPIRMNNRIISMRIIGQLFSWRIGQAQTLAGARIISTNTDGLYSVVGGDGDFDEATNNRVLAEQEAAIGVEIEPELMFLISKDSNSRLELSAPRNNADLMTVGSVLRPDGTFAIEGLKIHSAGGGTLACHAGPNPTKSLAHPAVIDFALARYLIAVSSRSEAALAEPFDAALGRRMIEQAVSHDEPVHTLKLFQNVIAASRGSITYPFASTPKTAPETQGAPEEIEDGEYTADNSVENWPLQMVNRVFIVKRGTPQAVSLQNAGAWKVTPISQLKRREKGEASVRRDPVALNILRHHGWARSRAESSANDYLQMLPDDQDVVVRRISSIDPAWSMRIVNTDLHVLPEQQVRELIAALDLDIYTEMLGATFTKNWRNTTP